MAVGFKNRIDCMPSFVVGREVTDLVKVRNGLQTLETSGITSPQTQHHIQKEIESSFTS
jgi:hypothetical protein